jgi:hypothetical protein
VIQEIFAFYEHNSPTPFLRFEEFSFDKEKLNQNTGKLYYIKGVIAHYSTLEQFENISNVDQICKFNLIFQLNILMKTLIIVPNQLTLSFLFMGI